MKTFALLLSCVALSAASSYLGQEHYGGHWSGHLYQPAPLNNDGTVAETPEVQAAKAYHLAVHAEARAKASYGHNTWEQVPQYATGHHDYYNPAPLNHDGTVAETPEVRAARLEHLAAHAAAKAKAGYSNAHNPWIQSPSHTSTLYSHQQPSIYSYGYGVAPLNYDGTVAETPEVKAARLEHLAAHAAAKAKASHHLIAYQPADLHLNNVYHLASLHRHKRSYWAPASLNHDGTVAETPEVRAATAAHLAAVAQAKSQSSYLNYFGHIPHGYSGHYQAAPLNHDGTVAETPEVQAAKAAHLAAVALAKSRTSYHDLSYLGHTPQGYSKYYQSAPLNHDGTVAETDAVRAAKQQHLAAHAEAKSRSTHSWDAHYPSFSGYYSAPLSHDGSVVETLEVRAAKQHHFAAHQQALSRLSHDNYHH